MAGAVVLARGRGEEGRGVLCRAAFLRLEQEEWGEAEELLLEGECDPREVASLLPSLLPAGTKFVRSPTSPPPHSIPSLPSSPPCLSFLLSYLRTCLAAGSPHLTDLHTAVARLLAAAAPEELPGAMAGLGAAAWRDVGAGWRGEGRHHLAGLALAAAGDRPAALAVWAALVRGEVADAAYPGAKHFVAQVALGPPAAVYEHAELVLAAAPEEAVAVFRGLGPAEAGRGLALLAPHPAPRLAYLRHLVEEEGSEVEAHHTQLALALLAQPEGGGGRAALSRLVLTSAHLNTEFLLHRLQGSDLTYERAVLMGRAGNHQVLPLSSHHHSPL